MTAKGKQPRVLFVVPRFHTNLFFATQALVKNGFPVSVFAMHGSAFEDYTYVTPEIFGKTPERGDVVAAFARAAPDLVFLRHSRKLSDQLGWIAQRSRAKVLGYDLRPLTQQRGLGKKMSLWLRGRPIDRVTPVRGLDHSAPLDDRATYLPWPVQAAQVQPVPAPADGRLRVLCVGKLAQKRKNHPLLIAAIKAAGLQDKIHLTLVGSSTMSSSGTEQQQVQDLRQSAQDEPWITLCEDVPYQDMPAIYASNDVCVMPSVGEPLGFAPVEAMAYGLVPVVSDDCGCAGYLSDGENGLIVAGGDQSALSNALGLLVENPDKRAAMADAAKITAQTDLGPDRFVERVSALLD